jgi:hypothetical protein
MAGRQRLRLTIRGPRRRELLQFAEAAALLVAARSLIRVLPFRVLMWLMDRPLRGAEREGFSRDAARGEVRRAVETASRRLPLRTACFSEAVAAALMLRRRGVSTTLHCGASTASGALEAHVWLEDRGAPVVGVAASRTHVRLASYGALPSPAHATSN